MVISCNCNSPHEFESSDLSQRTKVKGVLIFVSSLSIPKPIGPYGADVQTYTDEEVTTAIFQEICEWIVISNRYHIWERGVLI